MLFFVAVLSFVFNTRFAITYKVPTDFANIILNSKHSKDILLQVLKFQEIRIKKFDCESVRIESSYNGRYDVIKFEFSKSEKNILSKCIVGDLWKFSSKSVHLFGL